MSNLLKHHAALYNVARGGQTVSLTAGDVQAQGTVESIETDPGKRRDYLKVTVKIPLARE